MERRVEGERLDTMRDAATRAPWALRLLPLSVPETAPPHVRLNRMRAAFLHPRTIVLRVRIH